MAIEVFSCETESFAAASSNISSTGRNEPKVPSACMWTLITSIKVRHIVAHQDLTGRAACNIGIRRNAGSIGVTKSNFPSIHFEFKQRGLVLKSFKLTCHDVLIYEPRPWIGRSDCL
jgi:hypothetical protein